MIALPSHPLRLVRRFLSGEALSSKGVFERVRLHYSRATQIVRLYYLSSAVMIYGSMPGFKGMAEQTAAWDFLWPIQWMAITDPKAAINWLMVGCFVSSLLAFQFARYRAFRLLFAALFMCVAAVPNSLGAINHGYHAWLWIAICLILLPDARNKPVRRASMMSYLTVFLMTQALLLSFYTLAGYWKARAGTIALMSGQEGNFSPRGLSLQLADRMIQTNTSPLLADFVISQHWLSWLMCLFVIYVQFVAVVVVFRPRLHVLWAYLLIFFHFGTWLLMDIAFPYHVLFLGLFFALSPFRPQQWTLREVVGDLPIFGPVFRRLSLFGQQWIGPRPAPAE